VEKISEQRRRTSQRKGKFLNQSQLKPTRAKETSLTASKSTKTSM